MLEKQNKRRVRLLHNKTGIEFCEYESGKSASEQFGECLLKINVFGSEKCQLADSATVRYGFSI